MDSFEFEFHFKENGINHTYLYRIDRGDIDVGVRLKTPSGFKFEPLCSGRRERLGAKALITALRAARKREDEAVELLRKSRAWILDYSSLEKVEAFLAAREKAALNEGANNER